MIASNLASPSRKSANDRCTQAERGVPGQGGADPGHRGAWASVGDEQGQDGGPETRSPDLLPKNPTLTSSAGDERQASRQGRQGHHVRRAVSKLRLDDALPQPAVLSRSLPVSSGFAKRDFGVARRDSRVWRRWPCALKRSRLGPQTAAALQAPCPIPSADISRPSAKKKLGRWNHQQQAKLLSCLGRALHQRLDNAIQFHPQPVHVQPPSPPRRPGKWASTFAPELGRRANNRLVAHIHLRRRFCVRCVRFEAHKPTTTRRDQRLTKQKITE